MITLYILGGLTAVAGLVSTLRQVEAKRWDRAHIQVCARQFARKSRTTPEEAAAQKHLSEFFENYYE